MAQRVGQRERPRGVQVVVDRGVDRGDPVERDGAGRRLGEAARRPGFQQPGVRLGDVRGPQRSAVAGPPVQQRQAHRERIRVRERRMVVHGGEDDPVPLVVVVRADVHVDGADRGGGRRRGWML
ncbi:hypothetical protein ACU686_32390 [Yinghuangia aomiensis]